MYCSTSTRYGTKPLFVKPKWWHIVGTSCAAAPHEVSPLSMMPSPLLQRGGANHALLSTDTDSDCTRSACTRCGIWCRPRDASPVPWTPGVVLPQGDALTRRCSSRYTVFVKTLDARHDMFGQRDRAMLSIWRCISSHRVFSVLAFDIGGHWRARHIAVQVHILLYCAATPLHNPCDADVISDCCNFSCSVSVE